MSTAPLSMRRHIVFFGRTNSGKSSLFNAVLGQQAAIVSEKRGTTTDPVVKAMELIPFGPVALADTAGTGDFSDIGSLRMKKSYDMLDRADVAVYCADPDDFSEEEYKKAAGLFDKRKIRHLLVFTKADITDGKTRRELCRAYPEALFVSSSDQAAVDDLKAVLNGILSGMEEEKPILSGLLSGGAHVVMCIPIDSAAPKGRLILPQVQLIRECLDLGMTCSCATPDQLGLLIKNCEKVDLVVTDSQAFGQVAGIVPEDIKLTSFSMLLAAQKGDIKAMIDGAKRIDFLRDNSRVLIAEACTHNKTHEDIGTVKIPALIRKRTGKNPGFDFCAGHDFPDDLSRYHLVIHCGGCMITKREMNSRIMRCVEQGVPITNYGVALAQLSGAGDRCFEVFDA